MRSVKLSRFILLSILLCFVLICGFVTFQETKAGLAGLYWIVPFVYAICWLLFGIDFGIHEGGIGIKVLFGVMTVRYCVSPLLNALSDSVRYDGTEMIWAVLFQCAEIISVFVGLHNFYRKEGRKAIRKADSMAYDSKLSCTGIAVMLLLVAIMVVRGNGDEIWGAARFFLATKSIENKAYDSYSIIALMAMKAMIFIALIQWFGDLDKKHPSKIWTCLGCIVGCANFMVYFGNNRSSVVHCALATIFVLMTVFKRDRKLLITITVPLAVLIAVSLIFLKNFGIDITSGTSNSIGFETIARTVDAYFCGINNTASGQVQYLNTLGDIHFGNVVRDITNNVFLLKIPGFTFVDRLFSAYPTTLDIITQGSTAMVSVSTQMTVYFGRLLGLIADCCVQFFMMGLLSRLDNMVKHSSDIASVFICAWLAALVGMLPMYCLVTILWSASNTPFFLWLLVKVNNIGKRYRFTIGGNQI